MLAQKIEHNLHLVILFLSSIFAVVAIKLHVSFELVELMFVLIVTFGMIGASIYDSYQAEKKNQTEFKHFKTFRKGQLYVKNIGKQLDFTTDLFVVEHPNREQKLRNEINAAFAKDVGESNLRCHEFKWKVAFEKSASGEKGQAEMLSPEGENQKNINWKAFETSNTGLFRGKLEESKVVVVVLSQDFRNNAKWVYQGVDEWAKKNPDKPVLFIKPDDYPEDDIDEIPKLYYWIEEDAATIPWRLLKRSNKRTTGWENQSEYNRMFWKYAITLIGVLLGLGVLQYEGHTEVRKNYFNYRAAVLKKEFGREITKSAATEKTPPEAAALTPQLPVPKIEPTGKQNPSPSVSPTVTNPKTAENVDLAESSIDASIWRNLGYFSFGKPLFQEGSSDKLSSYSRFDVDAKTVIGCAFLNPNNFVEWNGIGNEAQVIDRNGNKTEKQCSKLNRPEDTMRWITCFAFQRGSSVTEMVGICLKNDPRVKASRPESATFNFQPYRNWLSSTAQTLFEEISKEEGLISK